MKKANFGIWIAGALALTSQAAWAANNPTVGKVTWIKADGKEEQGSATALSSEVLEGFVENKQTGFITVDHILGELKVGGKVSLLVNGKQFQAKVAGRDWGTDTAILVVDITGTSVARLSTRLPGKETRLRTVAFPEGNRTSVIEHEAELLRLNSDRYPRPDVSDPFELKGYSENGASGGAVINEATGEFEGMLAYQFERWNSDGAAKGTTASFDQPMVAISAGDIQQAIRRMRDPGSFKNYSYDYKNSLLDYQGLRLRDKLPKPVMLLAGSGGGSGAHGTGGGSETGVAIAGIQSDGEFCRRFPAPCTVQHNLVPPAFLKITAALIERQGGGVDHVAVTSPADLIRLARNERIQGWDYTHEGDVSYSIAKGTPIEKSISILSLLSKDLSVQIRAANNEVLPPEVARFEATCQQAINTVSRSPAVGMGWADFASTRLKTELEAVFEVIRQLPADRVEAPRGTYFKLFELIVKLQYEAK